MRESLAKPLSSLRRYALTAPVLLAPLLLLLCGLEVSQRLWRLLATPLAQSISFGGAVFGHTIIAAAAFLFVVMPLMAIEQIFPASRPSMRSYAMGILGWLPVWVFDYGTGVATQIVVGRLDVTPFLIVRVSEYATSSAVGLIFLNWFVFDFFYYWFHRMQHSIPLLWRIHALHHSIRELNSVMCFHHPIERLLRIIPITLPLALLVRFDEITVIPIASAFVARGRYSFTWIAASA